jgi:hypothetical protein
VTSPFLLVQIEAFRPRCRASAWIAESQAESNKGKRFGR